MFFGYTQSTLRRLLFRRIAAFIIEALEGLGSATSGGGRFPAIGIM